MLSERPIRCVRWRIEWPTASRQQWQFPPRSRAPVARWFGCAPKGAIEWDRPEVMLGARFLREQMAFKRSGVRLPLAPPKECMLEGASKFSREGFECGKNCKKTQTGLQV